MFAWPIIEKTKIFRIGGCSYGQSYFLFQAQNLDLPSLEAEAFLTGHIVEFEIGSY
ncbi:MAG: hypothetical protein R3B45_09510 [Bdellovibrionota bacterium]